MQRGKISDPRFDGENSSLLSGVSDHVTRELRPWTDKAHVSLKDIPELRNLIQLRFSEKRTKSRNAGISGCGDRRTQFFRPTTHGPKFPDREWLFVSSHSDLTKKSGAFGTDLHEYCDKQKDRRKQHQRKQRNNKVKETLAHAKVEPSCATGARTFCAYLCIRSGGQGVDLQDVGQLR